MCVVIFSTTSVWNIAHSKKKWVRYDQKHTLVFMQTTRYSRQILMKLEFPQHIKKKKYSNIIFHEDMYFGSYSVPCGQMDRHAKVKGHFSKFWELN